MLDGAMTAEQFQAAWKELARQKQTTPERAKYEYLCEARMATTVDDQGTIIPDLLTRALAGQLLDEMLGEAAKPWPSVMGNEVSVGRLKTGPYGIPIFTDESIPPDEIRVVESNTGKVLGKIVNTGSVKGGDR